MLRILTLRLCVFVVLSIGYQFIRSKQNMRI